MVSSRLADGLARRNIHYGWVVVAVTFLTMLVVAGSVRRPGRAAPAVAAGVRLEHRGDIGGHGHPPVAVRPDGTVRGGADQSLRRPPGCGDFPDDRCCGIAALDPHDRGLGADPPLGRGGGCRHRHDRAGLRCHRGQPLVLPSARAGDRFPHRQHGHRPARVHADPGDGLRKPRLAGCHHLAVRDAGRGSCRHVDADARSAIGPWNRAIRGRGQEGGGGPRAAGLLHRVRCLWRVARGIQEQGILGAVRQLLHLRCQHQRPDPDPPRLGSAPTMA